MEEELAAVVGVGVGSAAGDHNGHPYGGTGSVPGNLEDGEYSK